MTEKTEGKLSADAGSETETEEDLWEHWTQADSKTDDEADDGAGDTAQDTLDDDAEDAGEADTDQDGSDDKDGDTDTAEPIDWKARAEETEHKWRSEQGRAEGQRKKAERLQKELEQARQQLAALKSDDEKAKQRQADLTKVREEYGDVMAPVLKEIEDLRARDDALTRAEQSRLEGLNDQYSEIIQQEEATFLREHKDGFDFIDQNRDAFRQWIDDQPREMREIFRANEQAIVDGTGAAMMVSRFKAFMQDQSQVADDGPPASSETRPNTRRKLQMQGARSSRSTGRQAATSDIPADSQDAEALFKYHASKLAKGLR